jgi:hypothetical protein
MDKWQICAGGGNESKGQSSYNHITHLELVDRALEKERCTLNNKQ